ncbi:MAG TPA: HAMP domain-containing sensor histidine kinase [Gaiellaceae bacterium]|nr:HAMP domain-containing sensor histidine kinase [Gaiellaceae bacterium]
MSFRARIAIATAVAVAAAIAVASVVAYLAVRSQLRGQVDDALADRAEIVSGIPIGVVRTREDQFFLRIPGPQLGGPGGYVQVFGPEGAIRARGDDVALPVDDATRRTAEQGGSFYSDARVAGIHVRILTTSIGNGYVVQIARPLTEVDDNLDRLRTILVLVALGGIGLAAALGLLVARTALAPVRRLTEATEEVTETRDLSRRMADEGTDELGRLAGSFNTMLAALEDSARSQRRFVADASHELRTPLTSLRTNIEVLARSDEMPPEERERLLADVVEQLAEMSELVAELVALDRVEDGEAEREDVRLDLVAGEAIDRVRRNRGGVTFVPELAETVVSGVPGSLERAIGNLLDNAAKWSPEGGEVEVRVGGGEVAVRDHGPGIDDEDLPYVFDRFYRASSVRGEPGSGLGLAIVRRVAEAHGGEVTAERADGGGTLIRLKLPVVQGNGAPPA